MKRFLPILILLVFAIACDKQITTELSLNPTDVYIKKLYSELESLRPGEQIDLGVTLVGTSSEWTYEWTCDVGTVSGDMTSIIWSAPFEQVILALLSDFLSNVSLPIPSMLFLLC